MCLIINGKMNDILALRKSSDWAKVWRSNSDGAAMLVMGKEPKLLRTMDPVAWNKRSMDLLSKSDSESEVIVHWRMGTHGETTMHNVHPFRLDKEGELLLFHNGIVCGFGGDRDSDTHDLAKVLRTIPKVSDKLKVLNSLSRYNRFAVADLKSRETVLLGDFEEYKGVFHSNRQILPALIPGGFPLGRKEWIQHWNQTGD